MTSGPKIPGVSPEPAWTGTEPLIGWRVWQLAERRGRPMLAPATASDDLWPALRPFRAGCRATVRRHHRAPDPACACGIYASDSLVSFLAAGWTPDVSVIGQVSLWGRVVEHTSGWRAAFAYPARLRLICAGCLRERRGAGTPAVVGRVEGRLVATCLQHAGDEPGWRGDPRSPAEIEASLLATYAVDLLPTEPFVDMVGSASSPRRNVRAAARPWRALRLAGRAAVRLGQAAFAAAFLWIGCADAFTVVDVSAPATHPRDDAPVLQEEVLDGPGADSVPSPDGAWPARGDRTDGDGSRRDGRPTGGRLPRFAIVCGTGHGTWIEPVRCGDPRGDLLGFARNPPERACPPAADATTRRDRFSVCWFASSDGAWLAPNPSSASPFLRDAA
ncbi:MAG TPA: hypothetical protein VF044_10705 [Actinomycetota bacterium]